MANENLNQALASESGQQMIAQALQNVGMANVGDMSQLQTSSKTSLVAAVNELAGDVSDLDTDKADKVSGATNGNLAKLDSSGNLADSGWKSDKTTTAVSGNPISISGLKSNQLAVNPIITLEPIQSGSGTPSPSNVRAISGYDKVEVLSCGKNIWDGTFKNAVLISGTTWNANSNGRTAVIRIKASTYFTVSKNGGNRFFVAEANEYPAENGVYTLLYNGGDVSTGTGTVQTSASAKYLLVYCDNAGANNIQLQVEESQTATTYESPNKTTSISESLGQTVYGGNLDVRSGIFTKTWGYIASYAGETLPSEWISDRDEYVSGTTPTTGAEVAYKLANANYTKIQLTPHETSLLKDYAYVSTNGTSISLSYHNGELASLGDVEALGETVNNLGDDISFLMNKRVNINPTNKKFTSSTTLAYTGYSITIPRRRSFALSFFLIWENARPQQLVISTSSTSTSEYLCVYNSETATNGCICGRTGDTDVTFYVWAKYNGATTNTLHISGWYEP